MEETLRKTKKLGTLEKGDIVTLNVPFEENTRDYYNGYKPEEIRDKPFTDRFGKSSKRRMVIYIGRDRKDMLYLPVTSKTGQHHDILHQYQLKDNSMTLFPDGPKYNSYVEVDSLRAIRISYYRDLCYVGRIGQEDLDNIMHRISNRTLQFNSKRDQRGYIPASMEETFVNEIKARGYVLDKESDYEKRYRKEETGQSITRTKYGEVYYHHSLTKEEVRKLVSLREGQEIIPPKEEEEKQTKEQVTFSDTVNQLSKHNGKEIAYANTC